MVLLALVGTIAIGCSSDEENSTLPPTTAQAPQPNASTTVTLTTTISRGGESNARTRALTPDGKKTFAVGDKIAVVYTNKASQRVVAESNALTAEDITNEGKNAKITVTLTNPEAGNVDYIYPAAMAKSDGTINYSALCMQDGTLATLASTLDCGKGTGELLNTGSFALPAHVVLRNQFAICKFTIKNSGGTEITSDITGLTLTDGTNTYTVNRAAASGPIYVAMQPVTSDKTLSFVANSASNSYYKDVSGKALAANDMVPVNLTMTQQGNVIDLSTLEDNCTAQHGDMLIGKLGTSHKISIAAGAIVVLNGVSINYDTYPTLSGEFPGITCLGNATLIVSGTELNKVKGFKLGYPAIFVPSGSTLTITGSGTLDALGHEYAAAIGSGLYNIDTYNACGNIVIQGGNIYARGGNSAAGIGSGASINYVAPETGPISSCGNITIRSSVTKVNAWAGDGSSADDIGSGQYSSCGTVTIE